ncbi:molybdate transport system ATP-binding protein [Andreprevotia lacus DSM 23236]|jgi:molybdate transport system ATP-binding protein|uniref:Molybdate transport system ATP-binding protein n=1 Tax=Andreprevotia lacus DSM 23236 TaxID=1121001 RepID=A0A1W1WZ38_9NEIS|nr:ATP-binding cassette domain-containing protein [Andreprevotia lacus]SMC16708.1 molybdate transport system ATP-binding protein [Andreprevotia lacus DSM 23236]
MSAAVSFSLQLPLHGPAGPYTMQVEGTVAAGHTLALYGPSGAGKTSLLRMLCGLTTPAAGWLQVGDARWFDAERQAHVPAQARHIGVQMQQPALFPHLNALQQLRFAGASHAEAHLLLDMMELSTLAGSKPARLSGGQQQRLALARALARKAPLLLLDEPLSAQDSALRLRLQDRLREQQRAHGFTLIVASHEPAEIVRLADEVWQLDGGQIVARGTPAERLLQGAPHGTVIAQEQDGRVLVIAIGGGVLRMRAPAGADCLPGTRMAIDATRLLP